MCWIPKIRKANIPDDQRDVFERFGEFVIGSVLTGGFRPAHPQLTQLYSDLRTQNNARDWLTERDDLKNQHEWRLEIVEWAIFIFVVVGVILDLLILIKSH
jgi:hypothetical protein